MFFHRACITGNRPELDKPELAGLSRSQFPSTRMENFLPTVPNEGPDQPQSYRTFPAPLRRCPTAEGLLPSEGPRLRGENPIKAALRSKPGDQVSHLSPCPPPPAKKKISNQGIPVGKYTLTLEVLPLTRGVSKIRQDQTRPAPFLPPPPLHPPRLPHILQEDHLHLHRVHLHIPIILFLLAWGFAKMAAPTWLCISQGQWFGT